VSEHDFERRVAAALHASAPTSASARRTIMERVRSVPPHERPRSRRIAARFTTRHSIAGLTLAAGIGSITTMFSLPVGHGVAPAALGSVVIGDSVSSTLRDTLRLVRLIFDDSTARAVAAVGDFNGWRADATPLQRVGGGTTHRWSATVALKDGAYRYAFVVDGTRWVPDPAAAPVRADDGRVYSLLHVTRANN
jgi:Glycogen recognition site of AMP-activated protein kinase